MEGKISIRQYAKNRGCTDTAVHKAIRSGKIVGGVWRDEGGRPWILPGIADTEWGKSRDITNSKSAAIDASISKKPIKESAPVPPPDGGMVSKMVTAKLVKLTAEAKMKQLDYEKKAGTLVERDKVYSALFSLGQEVRAALQIIPDRCIDEILGAKDRNEAHTILTTRIAEALEALAPAEQKDIKLT